MSEVEVEIDISTEPLFTKRFIIFAALNLVVLICGITLVYISMFPPEKVVQEEILMQQWEEVNKGDGEKHLYTLVPFNANLNGYPRRFVRLSMQLEMLNERSFEEVSDMGAEARDVILKILNEKTVNDVKSVQGKLILKEEIMMAVNGFLNEGIVKNAYFTEFGIQ